MMPRWSKPMLQGIEWPSQDEIMANRRQMELRLWQFHAGTPDTFGLSYDVLARVGLDFIQDPCIAETLHFRCLLCGKCFFLHAKFTQHLNEQHNYRQLKTLMCRHRLELQCQKPCQFCNANQHSSHCLPLLNRDLPDSWLRIKELRMGWAPSRVSGVIC